MFVYFFVQIQNIYTALSHLLTEKLSKQLSIESSYAFVVVLFIFWGLQLSFECIWFIYLFSYAFIFFMSLSWFSVVVFCTTKQSNGKKYFCVFDSMHRCLCVSGVHSRCHAYQWQRHCGLFISLALSSCVRSLI